MAANQEKIDLFKEHKEEYRAGKKPAIVRTTPAQYLCIEGQGPPGGDEFEERIGALYGMAFTIKMTRKFAGLGDYVVCKLEAIWSAPKGKMLEETTINEWCWKMMIRTPDCVKQADLDRAVEALLSKGKAEKVKEVRLETICEGQCVQMLHVGPYEALGGSYTSMGRFAEENNLTANGNPHDIYLSDPRRVDPEKLKTIIRRPVK